MAVETVKREVPDEVYKHEDSNKKMEIYREQHPIDPREHDNLTTMECSHKKYTLGDKQFDSDKHSGWAEVKSKIKEQHNVVAIKPLYLLDHSGLRISTSKMNNPWDSGQVGYAYITESNLDFMGIKEEDRTQENYRKWIKGEVEQYDDYLRGNVWRYKFYNSEGHQADSCGGFYGDSTEQMFNYVDENREEYKLTDKHR